MNRVFCEMSVKIGRMRFIRKILVMTSILCFVITPMIYYLTPQVLSGGTKASIDYLLGTRKIYLYGLTTRERLKAYENIAAPYSLRVVEGGCIVGDEGYYEDMAYNAKVISQLPEDIKVEFTKRFVGQVVPYW